MLRLTGMAALWRSGICGETARAWLKSFQRGKMFAATIFLIRPRRPVRLCHPSLTSPDALSEPCRCANRFPVRRGQKDSALIRDELKSQVFFWFAPAELRAAQSKKYTSGLAPQCLRQANFPRLRVSGGAVRRVARLSAGNILIRRTDSPACLTEACRRAAKVFFARVAP
jgi:hypothetical protein